MAEHSQFYAEAARLAGRFADAYALTAPGPELEPFERETLLTMLTPYLEGALILAAPPTDYVADPIRSWESLMRRKPGPVTFEYDLASGRVRAR